MLIASHLLDGPSRLQKKHKGEKSLLDCLRIEFLPMLGLQDVASPLRSRNDFFYLSWLLAKWELRSGNYLDTVDRVLF